MPNQHPMSNRPEAPTRPFAHRHRLLMACGCALLCLSLAGCSGGGIYANVGIAGPSVDLGPVSINTGVHLGRWL
jgi:hypothetical protein